MNLREQFLNLYNAAPKASSVKGDIYPKDTVPFKDQLEFPVALANVKKHLDLIPITDSLWVFYEKCPTFWMIPMTTTKEIMGFVVKGLGVKEYRTVSLSKFPPLLGFSNFKDFKPGTPVMLVEGAKDQIYASRHLYPYTLGICTNRPSEEHYDLLMGLTNKFLIALDNDKAGRWQSKEVCKTLIQRHQRVVELNPYIKDFGEYYFNSMYREVTKGSIQQALEALGRVNVNQNS